MKKDKKKIYGQFFTNPTIADFMVELALTESCKNMLDPCVGEGIFTYISSHKKNDLQITACEIDPLMIQQFRNKNKYKITLLQTDYLLTDFKEKFDCIICNPPYNRFQEIYNRDELRKVFKRKYNISLSGYSNICVYFLIKSLSELKKNGKCCYIVPYEFLNTGYGTIVKQYLIKSKMLKAIYKFSNKLNLFDEAITTSCILLLENKTHDVVELINVENIEEIKSRSFGTKTEYRYNDLSANEKWLQYFNHDYQNSSFKNIVKLSDYGKVSRGIATGNNSYFTLNESAIKQYKLSADVCLPCITKSSDISDVIISEKTLNKMKREDKKIYLFDGKRAIIESDFQYIQYGEKIGVNNTYLTSHRNPWFMIEEKSAAPILISVFSRSKLKVIRNELMIKNLTTFHGLYLVNNDIEFANILFCYLLTPIAQKIIYNNKREYGDGLDKFEPNDLNNAYILDIAALSNTDKQKVLRIYKKMSSIQEPVDVEILNDIFSRYLLE